MSSNPEDTVKKAYSDWSRESCGFKTITSGRAQDIKEAISVIHKDVLDRYYGCGMVVPEKLEGQRVVDLGCGAGRDTYIVSKLIGPEGSIVGVDMTETLIEVASKHVGYHTEKFGFSKPNVEFHVGYIEKLGEKGIEDNSCNILVSNGVINLTSDKKAVLQEAYRVLKDGGELYFSDVYCNKDLPEEVRKNEYLWSMCIAGSLYWKRLHDIAQEVGFCAPRIVEISTVAINNEEYKTLVGDARFVSVTYRMFKLPAERKGPSTVVYKGDIKGYEKEFKLDVRNVFRTCETRQIDSELATFLATSRFKDSFTFLDNLVVNPFDYVSELESRGKPPGVAYSVN
ncbi:arsenite methyltransferase-like [Haliotis rufescens]|uniref:arsenite methyltransferase-like n=1 Tax=Haliotis rufescens TaxID=6454 RepID=UPI001EB00CB0|nr:arsenite methyltransferase-like [Haliotis rufescens]XP_046349708.1 arsenite methyltransferase-like [Haliotis rufescens]XP_046349757.1 arsenite methyltransferase-like [Haliotis rufescens]XP_046349823.1 arsenite methyltransferase-like [Haliotis rufescens]XP_048256771.1 arsenite methyltransferase-like [Haliotis rufescens]XP_048256772.1 arsenite methyltransferase-like [Haliotis rufescens]XP_048256773.1 arsenite methyltransferase-like [Haliotis rufescens]